MKFKGFPKRVFALKSVRLHNQDVTIVNQVKNEIRILKKMKSKYVIRYYGVDYQLSSKGKDFAHIFMEYADLGDLRKVLNT